MTLLEQPQSPISVKHLNLSNALKIVGGDYSILQEMVAICENDLPPRLEQLREAVATKDATKVEQFAHQMKGGLSVLCAEEAYQAALALERASMQENQEDFSVLFVKLEETLTQLFPELTRILETLPV